MGLGAAIEQTHHIETKLPAKGVSVCPGPNLAYFSKIMSLKEITDHIYGRMDVLVEKTRPHMFLKEINLYADYLKDKIEEAQGDLNKRQEKYLLSFSENLKQGISYYEELFTQIKDRFQQSRNQLKLELQNHLKVLEELEARIRELASTQEVLN
jgi:hypothetical protein